MLEFIGGVPRMIIPDNTSTAVNHNGIRKERETNPSYQEFAEHYNTAIIPARVRRPKDYRQKSVIGNSSLIHPIVSAVYRFFTDNNFFQHAQLISYF